MRMSNKVPGPSRATTKDHLFAPT